MEDEIVWIVQGGVPEAMSHGIYARLVRLNAFNALIRYSVNGIDYEVWVDNDEIEFLDDEQDDDE